ncbi:hypothetical protein A2U01_0076253, partial [Trifolium medium]|nr:hypothetical protein [Trifolium medium]
NCYGVGACIRDENGIFVQAYMKKFEGRPLIAEAEARGIMEVLIIAHGHLKLKFVGFELETL